MSKPHIHAQNSAEKFGGKPEDYIEIHQLLDSSKSVIADSRHRALTHNSWFIGVDGPLERIFGVTITNSDGNQVSVRDIGEQHILEDYGDKYIPAASDFLAEMNCKEWMNNGDGDEGPMSRQIFNQSKGGNVRYGLMDIKFGQPEFGIMANITD